MKKTIIIITIALFSLNVGAQQIINLYDGPAPGMENAGNFEMTQGTTIRNVSIPTLQIFLPDPAKATGAAMVVCPGGAFISLAYDKEGTEVAQWLAERGIAAFVLKYRLRHLGETEEEVTAKNREISMKIFSPNNTFEDLTRFGDNEEAVAVHMAWQDGLKAMETVRAGATEYGINPDKIGIMGFSAGAVLTMNVGMYHSEKSKPNLVVPVYMGWTDQIVVPEDAAPLYMDSPQNDLFPPSMTFDVYKAWTQAGVSAELHYHAGTRHGYGIAPRDENTPSWIEGLYSFMKLVKFIE